MPTEVLTALELRNGNVVADIGAGIGYFTLRFAKAVGPRGRVDLAFLCETVHEITDRVAFYRKVRESLKGNGRMAAIESLFCIADNGAAGALGRP